jgi:hypothetical protein
MGNRDDGWAEWELPEQRENPWQPSVRFQAGRRTSAIPFRASFYASPSASTTLKDLAAQEPAGFVACFDGPTDRSVTLLNVDLSMRRPRSI